MNFDPRDMSKSAHNAVKVILGIDLPRASPASMRAVSEVYDRLSDQLTGELVDVMDTTRSRVRRNFGGAASDHYDRSLAAFTSGDKDYIGKAASTSRMLSGELRKAAANVDYMVSMVWVQLAQLIAEIAWAIATAKFTFGASLSWIPVFKAIRSLAIRRLLAWLAFTVPSHQIVSHIFASFGELIQRVQIANGERDEFDKDLQREAHVGAVIEGLISAGISGGLGAYFKNGFTEVFVRNIDDLRALPDPLPTPVKGAPVPDSTPAPVKNDLPLDPAPPPKVDANAPPTPRPEPDPSPVPSPGPGTLNNDLADVFARQQDEMLVPFHPNSPPGARAWDNTASRAAFRDDMADLFQRTFGGSLGVDQARRLGDDYANTLTRSWSDPDLGSQLSKTLGDRLPAHLRDHLVDVPQNLFGSLRQSTGGFLQYLKQLGIGAGSGAVEGTLGEGLGNAANGQGFTVTPWSATSGAIMNPGQQITTDSTLVGIDALKGPDGTILAPDLPPPPEPEPTPEADAGSANREVPPTAPSSGAEERTNPSSDPSTGTPAPPKTDDRSAPALDPEAASHARPTDTRDPASQDGDDTVSRDVDAATGENAPEPTVERPDTHPEASEARATAPPVPDDTGASRPNTGPAPPSDTQERPQPGDSFSETTGSTDGRTSETPVAASAPPVVSGPASTSAPVAADRGAPGPAPDGGRPERSTGEQGQRSPSDPQGSTQTRQEPSVDGRTPPATESGPTPDDVPISDEGPGPSPSHGRTPADVRTESGRDSADGSSARPSPGGADRPAETAPEPGPAPRPVHETDAPNTEADVSATSFSFDALLNPTGADHDSSYETDDEVSDVSSVFDDEVSDTMSVTTDVSDTKAPDTGKDGAESGYVPGKSTDPLGTPDAVAADRTTVFPVLDVGPDVPPPVNGDTTALPPAMARAEEALDHLDRLTRHLDDGDLAQARAVGADIQRLLSPRPTDGAPQNPSVQRARHLALGLVFTLSDPTDRRVPIDQRSFSAEKAEDAGALIRGIDRNLRDRDEPVRARLWLPGGRLDTGDVRRVAQAPPPSGENTPATTTSPSVDLTGGGPVPTQSVDSAAHAGPSPSRPADAQASAPTSRPGARAAEALDRLPQITRSLMAGDTRRAWALGAEVQRLLVHRADDGSTENPSDRQARQLALAMMYVLSDPSNRKVPLSGEDLPPRRLDDALGLVRGIGRNLQDRDDPIRARLWLPGGRLNTDYVVNAMRDPADRNLPSGTSRDTSATVGTTPSTESVDTTNASEETASTGDEDTTASSTPNRENALTEEPGPELTVNVMTQDTEDTEDPGSGSAHVSGPLPHGMDLPHETTAPHVPAHGPGQLDSTGIRRFPGEVGLIEYGDRLHDPAFNSNTHDALPTRTRRYIQAYTAESWIAEFSRLRPLDEETVQAELDRRRQESQTHPGWLLYEIGNGRWPDLRVLRPRLDAGVLTPEQARVVREVLDSPYPDVALDGLRSRAGSAGRIADTLRDKRKNGYYPDAQDVLDIIERLDQATRHPLPEGVEAVRGVYGFEHLGPGSDHDPDSLVGNTYTDPGYMSLSLGDRPGAAGGPPTDLIHFTLPQGTQGLWVGKRSLHPHEHELILARDTTYQITSTEPWGRGHLLHARIIPPGHGPDPHTATESSDEVTVMAVTRVEGSVQAPDAGATSLSDPDALAHGMGLTDGSGGPSETAETGGDNTAGGSGGNNGAEGTATEGDTTIGGAATTLEAIRRTADRLDSDIADLTTDIRRTEEATTRAAAFDRLEQVGSSFGDLVTRVSAMAGTIPEAIDITARLASDIATAANEAARLSANTATGARDNIRRVPTSPPQDLDGITRLAQTRDAADSSVTAAGTAHNEAGLAARVAAQVTETITGVTGTAGEQAQTHAKKARTASEGANSELQRAQEAARETVTRQESLVNAVDRATSDGVERALETAAAAHTNVTSAIEAVETAGTDAETAAVRADDARALTEMAVADGHHDDTVDHVVQAFDQVATARSNLDAIRTQIQTIRKETGRVQRALSEAEQMADLSSDGSPARTRLASNRVAPPSLDPEGRSAAEVDAEAAVERADAAVDRAREAAKDAVSLPVEALRQYTGEARESVHQAVREAETWLSEVIRIRAEVTTAGRSADSALGRTRSASDVEEAEATAAEASNAAGQAELLIQGARSEYADTHAARASFDGLHERYDAALSAARANAETARRIAERVPADEAATESAFQARAAVHRAELRLASDQERMERAERVLDQVERALPLIEERALDARRAANEAHDQARHPREYPGTLPRDESAKTYDLDYLVRSRLIAPDRLYTERVPEVVEYLITAQAPDMPTSLHSDVASQIDSVARTQGMAVFFSPQGFAVTVTDGTGDDTRAWTIQVALESATQDGFRHLALSRESGAPLEGTEEERTHATKRGGASSHDPRRGGSARFTASPMLVGDVTGGFAAGPWLTLGGGYTGGRRSGTAGGNVAVSSALEYMAFGPPEVYLNDLRVRVKVTPPADAPSGDGSRSAPAESAGTASPPAAAQRDETAPAPAHAGDRDDGFQSGVIVNGMALVLPGEVAARPDDVPASIDLTATRPGQGAEGGTPARLPDGPIGGLPISITSVTPRGDGASPHSDLGSWIADYLVSDSYVPHREAMGDVMVNLTKESTQAKIREWQATIRKFFDNDSIQEYLAHLDTGPMTVEVTHPVLGDMMLKLSSTPNKFTAKEHTPSFGETFLKHTVEESTSLGLSRNSNVTASVGGGLGIVVPLPTGGSIRLNMPHVEYTWGRTLSAQSQTVSASGDHRSLAHHGTSTETFTAFDVERTVSVELQEEQVAHTFDVRTVELLQGESATNLQRAATGEDAPSGAEADRVPPFTHLRGERVVDFSGTHHHSLTRVPPPEGERAAEGSETPSTTADDDRGVLETLTDRILEGIAREHPGLVLPELSRKRSLYALKPGQENTSFFKRSFRERWGLRRSYNIAHQNTLDVRNAVRDAMNGDNRDRLASADGLRIQLRESALVDPALMARDRRLVRPDVLTLALKADFSALTHQGTTTAETGVRMGGSTTLGSESGTGSSHALSLSFGSGMMRSAEADAHGLARLLGGVMASLRWSRINRSSATHGVSYSSNNRFVFPGDSDRWEGTVGFTARLYDDTQVLSGRTDNHVNLFESPVEARYSLITPKKTTEVPLRGGAGEPSPPVLLPAAESRAIIDPRPEDLAALEPGDVHERRARAAIDNGATIDKVGLTVLGDDATASANGVLQKTFDTFTDRRPVLDGRKHKLRGFLDTIGGRHFFTNFLSPVSLASDPATFSPSGHRGRVEMGGTWRSPNDMRAAGATIARPERIVGMHAIEAQVAVTGESSSSAGAAKTKTYTAGLSGTGFAGGTSNTLQEDGAASGADRSASMGPTPMGGPSHNWNFFRRGETLDSGVSSTSGLFLLTKPATVYTFRMGGSISQAWEFKKHRGLNFPNWWSHKYVGWKAWFNDLASGFITARDAEQGGIIDDAVAKADDGTLEPATQRNPTPPANVRVRTGFDGAGEQRRPADPTAAVRQLEERLRDQGLKLTRGGKERLLASLTQRLGNTTGMIPPVSVKVVPSRGTLRRIFHRSKPARVLVELSKTNPRVDYVTSSVFTVESHSWQAKTTKIHSRGKDHSSAVTVPPWQPAPYGDPEGGPGELPDSHPYLLSPAAGVGAARSDSENVSYTEKQSRSIVMESSGPFARITHDTSLTLSLETAGKDPVGAHADSGPVQTFHLASSLEFGAPTPTSTTPLDTAPTPPAVTPRGGGSLADAVTTATRALGGFSPAARDAIIMPTAVYGPDVRDAAIHTIAQSLGWKPRTAPGHREDPTPEQLNELRDHHARNTHEARRHIAERLKLDNRYTPIDNTLNPDALKGLFSTTLGHPEGTDILRIGRTQWRVAATPDFTGSRILTARHSSRLAYKEAEGQAVSHGHSQSGGTTATVAFRPTGSDTVDSDNPDRGAILTGSGDAAVQNNTSSSPAAHSLVTGAPPDMTRQRLGTAYLVEFDTTWTIGSRTTNKTPFGDLPQQFTTDHTNKVSAWISQSDAIRLGIITPEQARSADTPITAELDAATAMSDAEATYIAERAELPVLADTYIKAYNAHHAAPTSGTRASLDALIDALDPTPEARATLDTALAAHATNPTNATQAALDTAFTGLDLGALDPTPEARTALDTALTAHTANPTNATQADLQAALDTLRRAGGTAYDSQNAIYQKALRNYNTAVDAWTTAAAATHTHFAALARTGPDHGTTHNAPLTEQMEQSLGLRPKASPLVEVFRSALNTPPTVSAEETDHGGVPDPGAGPSRQPAPVSPEAGASDGPPVRPENDEDGRTEPPADSNDVHVFMVETNDDSPATEAGEPGLARGEEDALAAALGLDITGNDDAEAIDPAYDDRPLLERWDEYDDFTIPSAPVRTESGTGPVSASGHTDVSDAPGDEGHAVDDGVRRFRTREELDAYAEHLTDPDTNPHTYGALPEHLREVVTAHTGTDWLDRLARFGTSDPTALQGELDSQRQAGIRASEYSDGLNGWVLYEENGLSWPTLARVRELYSADALSPALEVLATDIFNASDPQLRLDHWYDNADGAGRIAKANGGVYPTAERVLELIRAMDTAVSRPLPEAVEVSFVMDIDVDLFLLGGYDFNTMLGTERREQGYLRVSLGGSPFVGRGQGTGAVVRLDLPEGGQGLWVGADGGRPTPHMIVLPRDTAYRITGVRVTDDGPEFTAEIVPIPVISEGPAVDETAAPGTPPEPSTEASPPPEPSTEISPPPEPSTEISPPPEPSTEASPPPEQSMGHVDDSGFRVFRAPEEIDAYDRWLQDPVNNPHAFDTLPQDQRSMVDSYTRSAWITRLARVQPFVPQTIVERLKDWRDESRAEANDPDTARTAHGWNLYEANDLTWPTLDRLREIQASDAQQPERTLGLIGHILTARDPAAELRYWYHNAGYAGVIARRDNGAYPDVDRTLELFGLLDGAVDRPLPEGVSAARGMYTIDHLLDSLGSADPRHLVGSVHTEPGYMSTTLGDFPFKSNAAPFPYLLRLNVPQGAHGLWIGSRSHDPAQRELTLARGTTYRITGVRTRIDPGSGAPTLQITADVILRPEPRTDLFSSGRVHEDGVRRFRTSNEAAWYVHQATRPKHGLATLDALPDDQRGVAEAFIETPWLADFARISPDTVQDRLDDMRERSRTDTPSTIDYRRTSGWELYEANDLSWPTLDRLWEILDAAGERDSARTRFITTILGSVSPQGLLDTLYHGSGFAGKIAAANGGVYPSAEGVQELLRTFDRAVGHHPFPEAIETTWVIRDPHALHRLHGYDAADPSTLVGTVQAAEGYTTVSMNPNPVGMEGRRAATVRLVLPAGAHGLWLGEWGARPHNHEIILARGMSYRVTAAESTADGLLLSAEVVLSAPARISTDSGTRSPVSVPLAPEDGPVPRTDRAGAGDGEGTATVTIPPGDGRGYVDDHGVRRFRSPEELGAYGRWLHDPANNPYAFDALGEEQQRSVLGYTTHGWLNPVVRENLSQAQIAQQLDVVRQDTGSQIPQAPMEYRGWELYEINDLTWPTLDRLRELISAGRVPERSEGFVRYILAADDPQAELDHWYQNAGDAGVIAQSNNGVFPTSDSVGDLLRRLDDAVDRPLPETVEVVRGLEDLTFLAGFRDDNPYSLIGTVHSEPGFMSTSLGNRLVHGHGGRFAHAIHLVLPQGARGLWIGERSRHPEERELILARGVTYRITRAGWGGSYGVPGFYIEAEVVVAPRTDAEVDSGTRNDPSGAPDASPSPPTGTPVPGDASSDDDNAPEPSSTDAPGQPGSGDLLVFSSVVEHENTGPDTGEPPLEGHHVALTATDEEAFNEALGLSHSDDSDALSTYDPLPSEPEDTLLDHPTTHDTSDDSDTHSTYDPLPSEPEDTLLDHPTTHDTSTTVPPPAGTGHVDDDGVRRLGTLTEVDLYGGWLEQNSLSAYSRLDPELQAMVRAYTEDGWPSHISRLSPLSEENIQRELDQWRSRTLQEADELGTMGPRGWVIFELNNLAWPSIRRLGEIVESGTVPERDIGLVHNIFRTESLREELEYWRDKSGLAGKVARANDWVYPDAGRMRELLSRLDSAVDRPLPEAVEVSLGMYDLSRFQDLRDDDASSLVGTVHTEQGYMSASLGGTPTMRSRPEPFEYVLRLALPGGSRGLWAGEGSPYPEDREVILPRGTGYRVTAVREENTVVVLEAEVLFQRNPSLTAPDEELPPAAALGSDHEGAPSSVSRGEVDGGGIRRFRSYEEIDAYDRWLQDPANNPHAFDTLTHDQQKMVDVYTRSAWLTRLARARPLTRETMADQLRSVRSTSEQEARELPRTAHGWDLYEANGLTWPTLDRLREIMGSPGVLPGRTIGLIDHILTARDPAAELRYWYHNAGYAGVIARHDNGTYPDVDRTLELFGLLDGAVDRPLPEGVSAARGMHTIDHLLDSLGSTNLHHLIGSVHTEPGYMSTTLGDFPFKTNAAPFPYLLRLNVPQGAHGLWIGSRSHDPEQRELTLARGTTYRITHLQPTPHGGLVIYADVLSLPESVSGAVPGALGHRPPLPAFAETHRPGIPVSVSPESPADDTDEPGHSQRPSVGGSDAPAGNTPAPTDGGRGRVDDDGIRRFHSPEELEAYGRWLQDPINNPHAYSTLSEDLRASVDTYVEHPWLTRLAREASDGDAAVQWRLDRWRDESAQDALTHPVWARGWKLYQANELVWPDLERLRELDDSGVRDLMAAGLIDAVLRSDDPQAELDFWKEHAGIAGHIATSNGGVYPTSTRARELLALLDRAVERPLPEGVEVSRGLYDLAFMPGYEAKNPYQLIGAVYTDPGFMSVTLGDQPVKAQSSRFEHVIRFALPKGGHGLWIGGQSSYTEERESLLPRGTTFRVLRAGWGGSQGLSGFFIEAEILLPPGPGPATSSTS